MSSLTRGLLDALLPRGSAWFPAPGGDLDDLLNGIADNWGVVHDQNLALGQMRDPNVTQWLSDLEIEYGVIPDATKLDATRRKILAARKFTKPLGTIAGLQAALDVVGFGAGGYGLTVYDNNGNSNPTPFTQIVPQIVAGQSVAVAGNSQAYAGFRGTSGILIVNGFVGFSTPDYWGAGMTNMVAGNSQAEAGYYLTQTVTATNYPIPQDSNYWSQLFFIAGSITYNGDGTIATLGNVNIPWSRQSELIDLICRIKPMNTWCVAAINWT